MMNRTTLIAVTAVVTALATVSLTSLFFEGDGGEGTGTEPKPLYWVAPMDPNYRRDQPGKSPMGMDLIPVYEEDSGGENSPGTVTITPDVENNLGVRMATVERRAMKTEINTVGYVQYDQDQLIHIHPRVAGWIEKLYVKAAGDPVAEGEPLYTLYAPELVNAQEELVLALSRGNSRLVKAAEARLQALQLDQSLIESLKNSRTVKQHLTFYAPQTGVVDNLNIREGLYVQPGTTLMSIGSLQDVWVEAEIFERQAALVAVGLPVTMTLGYLPGKYWQGRVDYVYPTLDSKTRTLRVRLRFSNADRVLRPNMYAQVEIHANPDENALVVPREAVIRTGSQDRVVLALGDGRFKSVAVKLGRLDDTYAEIVRGLDAGDRIVTSAQFLLDSESSKTSDFRRMYHGEEVADAVWAPGEILSLMSDRRMVTATHEPIPAWEWPEMTMEFSVADDIDIAALQPGTKLHMEITRDNDGRVEITGVHFMAQKTATDTETVPQATVAGVINQIDRAQRVVNISREAIAKWKRPPATMDFSVADNVDLASVEAGDTVNFTFEIVDGKFIVIELTPVAANSVHGETIAPAEGEHDHD